MPSFYTDSFWHNTKELIRSGQRLFITSPLPVHLLYLYHFPKGFILHSVPCQLCHILSCHQMSVLVQAVRIFEYCSGHPQFICFFVHFCDKLFGRTTYCICNYICSIIGRRYQHNFHETFQRITFTLCQMNRYCTTITKIR